MPPIPRPVPGPPRPPWPTPPPSPGNANTLGDLQTSRFRYVLHTSAKNLVDLFINSFSDPADLIRIRERHMASLHTSNIVDASISNHTLLDPEWEGVVEGAEEI